MKSKIMNDKGKFNRQGSLAGPPGATFKAPSSSIDTSSPLPASGAPSGSASAPPSDSIGLSGGSGVPSGGPPPVTKREKHCTKDMVKGEKCRKRRKLFGI
jgi:hypothetical protein